MKVEASFADGRRIEVAGPRLVPGESGELVVDGRPTPVTLVSRGRDEVVVEVDGRRIAFAIGESAESRDVPGRTIVLLHRNRPHAVTLATELDRARLRAGAAVGHAGPVTLTSAIPGVVRRVLLEPGAAVAEGTPVITLEAMKMENEIRAEISGRLDAVHVAPGQVVAAREPLAVIVPE